MKRGAGAAAVAMVTAVLAAAGAPDARAQSHVHEPDTNAHDGRWTVSYRGADGGRRKAQLALENFEGHWTEAAGTGSKDGEPCRGTRFPITVQASNASELEFRVWGSAVSPHCADLAVEVKPVDSKTLEGRVAEDRPIRMTRTGGRASTARASRP